MLRLFIFLNLILISLHANAQDTSSTKTTTYYFIRHAEKIRHITSEADVHLNEKGNQRARAWQDILQHIAFDAVYTTNFNRTKETGLPIALKNGLELSLYNVADGYNSQFKKATYGKTVLIVGHSNTIPEFINAVIGRKKYVPIEDTNNGNLYIVTIVNDTIIDILLTIN